MVIARYQRSYLAITRCHSACSGSLALGSGVEVILCGRIWLGHEKCTLGTLLIPTLLIVTHIHAGLLLAPLDIHPRLPSHPTLTHISLVLLSRQVWQT